MPVRTRRGDRGPRRRRYKTVVVRTAAPESIWSHRVEKDRAKEFYAAVRKTRAGFEGFVEGSGSTPLEAANRAVDQLSGYAQAGDRADVRDGINPEDPGSEGDFAISVLSKYGVLYTVSGHTDQDATTGIWIAEGYYELADEQPPYWTGEEA